jgi:ankyrin repeat protein
VCFLFLFFSFSNKVDCYLLGEKEWLRSLPQSKIHAAFDSAASGGRIDVMCELLASKPDQVGDLSYHLSKSSMKGRLGSIMFLLNYGADVNSVSYGRTPLTVAVENEQVDAVALLLSKGARVNVDAGGRGTALWWAASKNNPLLVQVPPPPPSFLELFFMNR